MDPLLGSIILFAGNFAPKGWALCDGRILPISQYSALFSILGTTYGGNGTTTFALPNLCGRAPVGAGTGASLAPRQLGESYGAESATAAFHAAVKAVTVATPPPPPTAGLTPVTDLPGQTVVNSLTNPNPDPQIALAPPSLAINFIIATEGVFPSRP